MPVCRRRPARSHGYQRSTPKAQPVRPAPSSGPRLPPRESRSCDRFLLASERDGNCQARAWRGLAPQLASAGLHTFAHTTQTITLFGGATAAIVRNFQAVGAFSTLEADAANGGLRVTHHIRHRLTHNEREHSFLPGRHPAG